MVEAAAGQISDGQLTSGSCMMRDATYDFKEGMKRRATLGVPCFGWQSGVCVVRVRSTSVTTGTLAVCPG